MRTVFRVFSYLKRYPKLASGQLACAVIATLLLLVFPKLTQHIVDDVIPKKDEALLFKLCLLGALAFFSRELFDSLRILLNNTFEQKVIYDLRSDLYKKIQRLPVRWFDKKPTGDVMTRVTEDVTAMERVLIDGIETGVISVLQIILVGGTLFLTNSTLAFIAMTPIPLLALGAILYTKGARNRHKKVRKEVSALNSLLHDNLDGIRQIKAYSAEDTALNSFNQASTKVKNANMRVMKMWASYKPGMAFLGSLGLILILFFGGQKVIQSELTIGELSQYLLLLSFFYTPVMQLHQLNQITQAGIAAADRFFSIVDTEDEKGIGKGTAIETINGKIEFRDVSFRYEQDEAHAITNLNLHANPGETIALVGSTGAGKSTIINLLCRFYEIDSGAILIDDKPIQEIEKRSLRKQLGYVTQESFLFNGTVRDNLLLGNQEATDDQLWGALSSSHAQPFVDKLPKKLETIVGERGVRLSVGERQRISVARALLENPPVLLLDEATASVDTATEEKMQKAFNQLMQNRTSIVIAHRLSTVQNADRIYVIDNGTVAEYGLHSDLIANNGIYAELCRKSFLDNEIDPFNLAK